MKTIFCLMTAAMTLSALAEPTVEYIGVDPQFGGARAVVVAEAVPLVHTAQLLPVDKAGKLVGLNDAGKQADQVLLDLNEVIGRKTEWVKLNVYVARANAVAAVQNAVAKFFDGSPRPAISFVVSALPETGALVGMDAVAAGSPGAVSLHSKAAVLPAGSAVYISGQAKEATNLADSTRKTLESLVATLEWLKLKKSDTVQVKAFMRPMSDIGVVKKEFAKFFGSQSIPPAIFVEWISAKPQIEIELIAAAGDSNPGAAESVSFSTPPEMKPSNVYSKVAKIERGKRIYFSSFYGNKGTGAEQVTNIFEGLGDWAAKAGTDMKHLVKATYYVSDNDAGNQLNVLRPKYYDPTRPPAASKAMVKGVGLEGRTVKVDMIAVTK